MSEGQLAASPAQARHRPSDRGQRRSEEVGSAEGRSAKGTRRPCRSGGMREDGEHRDSPAPTHHTPRIMNRGVWCMHPSSSLPREHRRPGADPGLRQVYPRHRVHAGQVLGPRHHPGGPEPDSPPLDHLGLALGQRAQPGLHELRHDPHPPDRRSLSPTLTREGVKCRARGVPLRQA